MASNAASTLEDDEISLEPTESEQYNSDQEFEVNRVLAEKIVRGKKLYLLLWENYPEEKSTWEPGQNINDEILDAWEVRKSFENENPSHVFDVPKFEAKLHRLAEEKAKRRSRRRAERKRRGIPVSPSASDADGADDSESSTEAIERDVIEDAPATKVGPKRINASSEKIIEPLRVVTDEGERTAGQIVESPQSTSSTTPRLQDVPDIAQLQKQSLNPKLTSSRALSTDVISPEEFSRRLSSSSSDGPPTRERIVAKPSSFSSNQASNLRRAQQKNTVEPTTTTTRPKPISTKSTPASTSRGGVPLRGAPSTQGGRGATRGASTVHKNVFALSSASKIKRGNLLTNAADTTKKPKQFSNKRLEWKAQVQAREKADAAPDLNAVGGLFNPSTSAKVDVRPISLRKASTNLDPPPDGGLFVRDDANENDRIVNDPIPHAAAAPKYQQSSFVKLICYYWAREQRDSNAPSCQLGTACSYMHSFKDGASIAPVPIGDASQESICFFWHRNHKDGSQPGCTKGELCSYLHELRPGAPVAQAPAGFVERFSQIRKDTIGDTLPLIQPPVSHEGSHPYETRISICYYWDRYSRGESAQTCKKSAEECSYLHEYRLGAPIAAPPGQLGTSVPFSRDPKENANAIPLGVSRGFDRDLQQNDQPAQYGGQYSTDQTSGQVSQGSSVKEVLVSQPQDITRPPLDPKFPFDAICYMWYHSSCKWSADICKYNHSNDQRLPIGPQPNLDTSLLPSSKVAFPSPIEHASHMSPRQDPSMSTGKGRPAWDPSRPYDAVCHFYYSRNGKCDRGNSCKYIHTFRDDVPLAPVPGTQAQTCRDWLAARYCRYKDTTCRFAHPPLPSLQPLQPIQSFQPMKSLQPKMPVQSMQPAQVIQSATSKPSLSDALATLSQIEAFAGPKVKSVKFADEQYSREEGLSISAPVAQAQDFDMMEVDSHEDQNRPEPSEQRFNLVAHGAKRSMDATGLSTSPLSRDPGQVKRNKINIEDYKRRKLVEALGGRGKQVIFGSLETKSLMLEFSGIEAGKPSKWKKAWEKTQRLIFTQICMAQDFRAQQGFFNRRGLEESPGSLIAGDANDTAAIKALSSAAEELGIRSAGLIATIDNAAYKIGILIYPAKKEEWSFLEKMSEIPQDVCLRYFIFQCDTEASELLNDCTSALPIARPYRMSMVERLCGLQLRTLLPARYKVHDAYHFFLLFPDAARESEDFITAWIKSINPKNKVHTNRNDGEWNLFAGPTVKFGVALVHESAAIDLVQMPLLYRVANDYGKTVSFWCVSESNTPYSLYPSRVSSKALEVGKILTTRLFPRGCAFFVTPSFLVAEPQKAFDLFSWFLVGSNGKPAKYLQTTPRSWKLVCCYKLSDYLLDVALGKAKEKEEFEAANQDKPTKDRMLKERGLSYDHCELRFRLHAILAKLDNQGLLEISSQDGFESDTSDEVERPFLYADKFIDPDDEVALVKWYAGWAVRKLDMFKKFLVIGTDAKSALRATRVAEVPVKSSPVAKSGFNFNISKKTKEGSNISWVEATRLASTKQNTVQPSMISQAPLPHIHDNCPMENGIEDDQILAKEIVSFIQMTGATIDDTKKFLGRVPNDVVHAVQLYNLEMKADSMISRESMPRQPENPGLSTNKLSQVNNVNERIKPPSVGLNENMSESDQHFAPSTVHLTDSSVRDSTSVQPEHAPTEDITQNQHPTSKPDLASNSQHGSSAMDLDNTRMRDIKGKGRWEEKTIEVGADAEAVTWLKTELPMERKVITYPATTEWAQKLSKERRYAWEHIFIGSHEKVFVQLGITKALPNEGSGGGK